MLSLYRALHGAHVPYPALNCPLMTTCELCYRASLETGQAGLTTWVSLPKSHKYQVLSQDLNLSLWLQCSFYPSRLPLTVETAILPCMALISEAPPPGSAGSCSGYTPQGNITLIIKGLDSLLLDSLFSWVRICSESTEPGSSRSYLHHIPVRKAHRGQRNGTCRLLLLARME